MAFSILIEINLEHHSWVQLNSVLMANVDGYVEFFPITYLSGANKNYIGMSILRKDDYTDTMQHMKIDIMYLLSQGCRVWELYSSSEFNESNCSVLLDKFFST